jgi:restriction system protein
MVVGQDWASEDRLRGPINSDRIELGYDLKIRTNINLQGLLWRHFNLKFRDIYATNAFPFIKPGAMQGKDIQPAHMRLAVREFLLRQVEIVQPKLVICLGLSVFNAVRSSCDHDTLSTLDAATKAAFDYGRSKVVAVAHTGARGTSNRGKQFIEQDWASIRSLLDKLNDKPN